MKREGKEEEEQCGMGGGGEVGGRIRGERESRRGRVTEERGI